MADTDLDSAWTVLETELPNSGIEVVPTGIRVNAGEVLAGVDSERRRYLLVPLMAGEAADEYRRGQAVQLIRIRQGGHRYLSAVCRRHELRNVFSQFARELLAEIAQSASPARAMSQALGRWRQLFLDEGARRLSEQQIIGLIAELHTVTVLLGRGAPSNLDWWKGPSGGQHDIRTKSHALEVKATLVREGRVVHISSVHQLQTSDGVSLHLSHFRFDRDPAGKTLPALVELALTSGADHGALYEQLDFLGYADNHADEYAEQRFRVSEHRIYDARDEQFPRITSKSFSNGHLPPGIMHLNYSVDLTNEPPHPLSDSAQEHLYTAIAGDA